MVTINKNILILLFAVHFASIGVMMFLVGIYMTSFGEFDLRVLVYLLFYTIVILVNKYLNFKVYDLI